jgi:hypothetical protein
MDDGWLLIARIRTQKADDVIAERASDKRRARKQDGEMLDGTRRQARTALYAPTVRSTACSTV